MKVLKLFTLVSLLSSWLHADVNVEVGVLRKTLTIQKAVHLKEKEDPVKVFQDDFTYVEAELISEKDKMAVIRFTIATRCETGAYMVRGLPHLTVNLIDGVGLSSMQCDSKEECFTLVMAVAPVL